MALRILISTGSIPSSSAIIDIWVSQAKRVWVKPWPRMAADTGLFVKTRQPSYL